MSAPPPPTAHRRRRGDRRPQDLRHRRRRRPRPRRGRRHASSPAGSPRSWARRVRASRPCCTASPASTRSASGAVFIGDTYLADLNDKQLTELRRTQVGFVFQAFNLIPTLTADENIVLPLTLGGEDGDAGVDRPGHRHRRPARSPQPPAERTVGWPAATRRGGARPGQPTDDHLRRRTDRQPRLQLAAPRSCTSCATPSTSSARRS